MDKDKKAGEPKEHSLSFALLIQKQIRNDGTGTIHVESRNQGVPDAEVFLIVEAWLEKMKDNFKNNITKGMMFGSGGQPPKK